MKKAISCRIGDLCGVVTVLTAICLASLIVSCFNEDKPTKQQQQAKNPVAHFDIYPVGGPYVAGDTLTFDASDSYDPQSKPLTYSWNFGDTTSHEDRICEYVYLTEGKYTVTLRVQNSLGYADTSIKYLNILAPQIPLNKPVARFKIIPLNNSFHADDTLQFDASDSYDPLSKPLTYSWDLGDGIKSQEKVFNHSYTKEGAYRVMLAVTNTTAETDTCEAYLYIHPGFPRTLIDKVEVTEKCTTVLGIVDRDFKITTWFTLRHFPDPYVYIKVEVREADGTNIHCFPWGENCFDREVEVRVASDPFTFSKEFAYDAALSWPDESAMIIASIWRDKTMSESLLAIDTTIAHYPNCKK
jgi:PKD repeat protein